MVDKADCPAYKHGRIGKCKTCAIYPGGPSSRCLHMLSLHRPAYQMVQVRMIICRGCKGGECIRCWGRGYYFK